MKNIRTSVFETNSSSTHSISISDSSDGILDTIVPNEDGAIVLHGGSFGWEWRKYNDALTKANYCAVDMKDHAEHLHTLAQVLTEHTGAKKIVFNFDEYSYVDHQSHGESGCAFKSPETLKDFIFNSKSWLFTGNDNDDSPPNFYDVDENIVYTHELVMDSIQTTVKFTHEPSREELVDAVVQLGRKHHLCEYRNFDSFASAEEYYSYKPYEWLPYDRVLYDGTHVSSLDKLDQDMVTIYLMEPVYDDENSRYLSRDYRVAKTLDISFQLVKI